MKDANNYLDAVSECKILYFPENGNEAIWVFIPMETVAREGNTFLEENSETDGNF